MPISLTQTTLRIILVPLNFLALIGVVLTTSIPFSKIPNDKYTPFVFWLFKPTLLIEIVLSITVLVMGFTGATKYNKCWQGSYSFFLFLLCIIAYFCDVFCKGIDHSLETVIPTILAQNQYLDDIRGIQEQRNCSHWNNSLSNETNCLVKIRESIGNYPVWSQKYVFVSFIILVAYTIINIFFFMFVSEFEESAAQHTKINDDADE